MVGAIMTTWIKKLRLYLLRRQLKAVNQKMTALDVERFPGAGLEYSDQRADLIDRIAEVEKSL